MDEYMLEDLELTRCDSVSAPANPLSWTLLAKAEDPNAAKRERAIANLAQKLRRAHPDWLDSDERAGKMASAMAAAMDRGEKIDGERLQEMLRTFGVHTGPEAQRQQRRRLADAEMAPTAKATTVPTPDLSPPPSGPVKPAPVAFADLRNLARERGALIGEGSKGTMEERQRRQVRLIEIDALLSSGAARQAIAEQEAAQRRSGLGVDSPVTTWDGRSFTTNPDGSRSKVTSTSKAVAKANVAGFIKSRRVEAQLTQTKLADAAQVSERAVKSWEAGDAVPSALTAHRLAHALGLDDPADRNAFAALLRAAGQT